MKNQIGFVEITLILLGALISASGTALVKKFSTGIGNKHLLEIITYALTSPLFWLGGLCYIVPIIFWVYLLRSMDISVLQPMLSVVYIFTLLIGVIFFNEKPEAMRLIGIGIVMTGVIVIGISS